MTYGNSMILFTLFSASSRKALEKRGAAQA
jgi:hypothetical protein